MLSRMMINGLFEALVTVKLPNSSIPNEKLSSTHEALRPTSKARSWSTTSKVKFASGTATETTHFLQRDDPKPAIRMSGPAR